MSVQARFYVQSMTNYAYNPEQIQVSLNAVTRGGANSEWAAATPSGTLALTINNPAATKWFQERMANHEEIALTFDAVPVEVTT